MSQIVVDTSALVAVFKAGKDWRPVSLALNSASSVVVPASCLVEVALLRSVARDIFGWVQELLRRDNFELSAITSPVAEIAAAAARSYGKGSGHPARLNFGDCLSYAVARYRDLPLLFVGSDFTHTDLTPALLPD